MYLCIDADIQIATMYHVYYAHTMGCSAWVCPLHNSSSSFILAAVLVHILNVATQLYNRSDNLVVAVQPLGVPPSQLPTTSCMVIFNKTILMKASEVLMPQCKLSLQSPGMAYAHMLWA